MAGLPDGLTVPNTAVGLIFVVVLLVLGALLRKLDKGSDAVVTGLGGLNDRITRDAIEHRTRAEGAERALARALVQLASAREYARSLEDDLGRPHRAWEDL